MKFYNHTFIKDDREFYEATYGIVFYVEEYCDDIFIQLFDGSKDEYQDRVLEIGKNLEFLGFEYDSFFKYYEYDVEGNTKLEKIEKVEKAYKKFLELINDDDKDHVFVHNDLKEIVLE